MTAMIAGAAILAGCVTQRVSEGAGEAAPRPITTEVVRMDSGPGALQAFEPLVRRVTEGGECVASDLAADGIRSLTMVFPTMNDPRTRITVVVDAAGSILQYTERRGGIDSRTSVPAPSTDPTAGPEQTSIEMNFQTGQARAINSGGGTVGFGVQGRAIDFQYHEKVGQPLNVARQIQQRCGGR